MPQSPQSPSSETPSQAGSFSPRTSRACDACHQRKIKCDGVKPQCNWCEHHALRCTFSRKQSGRKRRTCSRKLRESHFVERMERIEKLFAESLARREATSADPTPAVVEPTTRPSATQVITDADAAKTPTLDSVGRLYYDGYRLGDVNLFHGVPFLSRDGQKWIGFRTAQHHPDRVDDAPHGPIWQNQEPPWPNLFYMGHVKGWELPQLPPRTVFNHYLAYYSETIHATVFPIVDAVLFPRIIDTAYRDPRPMTREVFQAKAYAFAFLAFVPLDGSDEDKKLPPVDIEAYVAAAQMAIPDLLNARATTEVVDTLMMIAYYQFSSGNIQTVDIVLSIAARFIFMLGAHLYPGDAVDKLPDEPQDLDTRTVLHRRDMFWICYTLDREVTFRTGRPPIIHDSSCDLTFPKYYTLLMSRNPNTPWRLPGDLRLSIIKSRAYEMLYSPSALQKSDADTLKAIRELDDMLDNWRQSLHPDTRPTLTFSQDAQHMPDGRQINIPAYILRLDYHHCMTTIHQASSRCKGWTDNHQIDEALGSSLDLALQASRSLLSYAHTAEQYLDRSLFWVVIFYPLSAQLTLFCNILLHPASPTAPSDLALLKKTYQVIQRQVDHLQRLSGAQMLHLRRIKELVAEVTRLAEGVVLPARRSTVATDSPQSWNL